MKPKKHSFKRCYKALHYSINGLRYAWRNETSFKEEFCFLVAASLTAWLLADSFFQAAVLIFAVLLILVVELLNSALEKIADQVCTEYNKMIGIIKDLASAAVFLCIAAAIMLWLATLIDKINSL